VKEKTFSSSSRGKKTKALTSKFITLRLFVVPKGHSDQITSHLNASKDILIGRERINDWKNYLLDNDELTCREDNVKISQGVTSIPNERRVRLLW